MNDIIFSKKDVNIEAASERAKHDANNTINGPAQYRGNRTDEEIFDSALQGAIAEQYLIDNMNMKNCSERYHDLIDSDGKIVEVKTSKKGTYLKNQFKRVKEASWNKSDYMLGFIVKNGIYKLVLNQSLK